MHNINTQKLEGCMISLFGDFSTRITRTRYLSTDGIPIRDSIVKETFISKEIFQTIEKIIMMKRLLSDVKPHKSSWPNNPTIKDEYSRYMQVKYHNFRTENLTHTEMICWTIALYLNEYVPIEEHQKIFKSLFFHEEDLTPYVKFLELTGVCRIFVPNDWENIEKEVFVETYKKLTDKQKDYIQNYIDDNNIPNNKIYIDDHSS